MNILILTLATISLSTTAFAGFSSQLKLNLENSNQLHDANIYDEDNRAIMEKFEYPWSTIGQLSRPTKVGDKQGLSNCTGSLVGPDLVLTNAHCVLENEEISINGMIFSLQSDGRKKIASPYRAKVLEVLGIGAKRFGISSSRPGEWAILRLDRRLGDLVGTLAVRGLSIEQITQLQKTKTIYMLGYSSDLLSAPYRQTCEIKGMRDNEFIHNCSGIGGSSGSPILFLEEKEDGTQIGVIIALQWGSNRAPHYAVNSKARFSMEYATLYQSFAVNAVNFIKELIEIHKGYEAR